MNGGRRIRVRETPAGNNAIPRGETADRTQQRTALALHCESRTQFDTFTRPKNDAFNRYRRHKKVPFAGEKSNLGVLTFAHRE